MKTNYLQRYLFIIWVLLLSGQVYAQTDLALKKVVRASTELQAAANAVDGNGGTRWESAVNTDPSWISVDLEQTYSLTSVVIDWEAATAADYQVQGSNDNSNWTSLASRTGGTFGTRIDTISVGGNYRYVRMYGTKRSPGNNWGYSIWSLKVYGITLTQSSSSASSNSSQTVSGVNLALGKIAAASTTLQAAANAIDGNTNTRWESVFQTDPSWISVDLGTATSLASVVIDWEAANAADYQVQGSNNNSNWVTLATRTGGTFGNRTDTNPVSGSYRYVRIYGTARSAGNAWGYSIFELKIFGATGTSSQSSSAISSASGTTSYPKNIFFIGNSFTYYGPIPALVEQMARYNGFADVAIKYRANSGWNLTQHRNDTAVDGAPEQLKRGWDAVVLQDQSTRPTNSGDPQAFYNDVTWFCDYIHLINPATRVYLYETWAWRYDSNQYPTPFATPAQMQAELRLHYNEAALRYIPQHSQYPSTNPLAVAPVGDAWELDLQNGEADGRLHDADSHHAGALGQYLNALVFYSTLFDRASIGTLPLGGISETQAAHLQAIADSTTGKKGIGFDKATPTAIATGTSFLIDIGPLDANGWVSLTRGETATHINSSSGSPSSINVTVWGFNGEQTGGALTNAFGWPENVSRDSLWVGSNNTHADALTQEGRVAIRGLAAGKYRLEIFGSRDGDDNGLRRVTRFSVDNQYADLDTSNNSNNTVSLDVFADNNGVILLRAGVSPDSISRLGYLGAIKLTKL